MITKFLTIPFIIFFIIVGLLLAYKSQTSPVLKEAEFKTFTITPGQSSSEIGKNLKKEGLIKNSIVFNLFVRLNNLAEKIQAGSFKLSPSMSLSEIGNQLTTGTFDVWITIPEGFRNEEIAQRLNEKLGIKEEDFLKIAEEGYMFPDTYLVPKESTAANIVSILRENFDRKFSDELKQMVTSRGLTEKEVIILASIVEREALFAEDRPIVAGILLNRQNIAMALEADATVQYALGYSEEEKTWWRKNLTEEDLRVNSQYNTRRHAGLPPGPICNPGLSAIQAVINPAETDYLYYLSDKEGKMHYAVSLEEHIENINQYL